MGNALGDDNIGPGSDRVRKQYWAKFGATRASIWYKYLSGYEHHRFQFRLHLWKRTQRKMGHYNITFEDLLLDEDEFGEVDLFLRCVSEKLGDFDVQRLVCQCKTLIDLKESTGKQKYLKFVVLGEATLSKWEEGLGRIIRKYTWEEDRTRRTISDFLPFFDKRRKN